ncbi:MAG TPA: NUDIX hydrolase [Sphingomonadales bacterium]
MSDGNDNPAFSRRAVPGDDLERMVCDRCGWIHYENPKIIVGSVVEVTDESGLSQVMLCRRAIEPRRGFWTIPAGFMEEHETTEQGARREAREEACADIEVRDLLAIYSIPRISQVQLIYRARLARPEFSAGPESLEVRLFSWDEIPWGELAFPSVHWALHHFAEARDRAVIAPFTNPAGELGNRLPQGL